MLFSSKRIVLVDPLGEILFSGDSVIAQDSPADPEPCPETKRSAYESGTFPAAKRSDRPAPSVTEAINPEAAVATQKRGGRAA